MNDIYIIGSSGFGREVAWLIEELGEWNIKGFVDENVNQMKGNYKIVGNDDFILGRNEITYVVVAVANPRIREKIVMKLKENKFVRFPNIIAKNVRICNSVKLGEGNIICSSSLLTVDINMGDFNHVNLSCTIGHDTEISNFVTLYPSVNVSGNVKIHNNVEVGTGAKIIQGKVICNDVIIGAGSVVICDILKSGTYVGIPTKEVNKQK